MRPQLTYNRSVEDRWCWCSALGLPGSTLERPQLIYTIPSLYAYTGCSHLCYLDHTRKRCPAYTMSCLAEGLGASVSQIVVMSAALRLPMQGMHRATFHAAEPEKGSRRAMYAGWCCGDGQGVRSWRARQVLQCTECHLASCCAKGGLDHDIHTLRDCKILSY